MAEAKYAPSVGTQTETASFLLEAWHAREFRFALGGDVTHSEGPGSYAPSTIVHCLRDGKMKLLGDMNVDFSRLLHAEQVIEYVRWPRLGERLNYEIVVTNAFTREGRRGGTMDFFTLDIPCRDESGRVVMIGRQTFLEVESGMESRARDVKVEVPDRTPETSASRSFDRGPVDRIQIARYAGASGDYNRVHIDEPFAVASGRPSVWAHGMMGMGFLGDLLTGMVARDQIKSFSCRFVNLVFPGDVLRCSSEVIDREPDSGGLVESGGRISLRAEKVDGEEAGSVTHEGWAEVALGA